MNIKLLNGFKLSAMSVLVGSILSGCAMFSHDKEMKYDPKKYIPVDQLSDYVRQQNVTEQKVELELQKIQGRPEAVLTSYGFSQNPSVVEAYNNYVTGKDDVVILSPGFITYPYDPYAQPIIECAPLRVCTVQLEKGEVINSIQLGDTARWQIDNWLTGETLKDGSTSISIKPKVLTDGIATDMVISTNKRVYQLGLVSRRNAETHMVNFYYPQETLDKINHEAAKRYLNAKNSQHISGSQSTVVNTGDISTNYTMSGDDPAWKPIAVFDDGNKTFIKMPKISDRMALPIVWVLTSSGNKEPLNARYKHPYFILDGLYQKIFLISGTGSKRIEVTITNHNITDK